MNNQASEPFWILRSPVSSYKMAEWDYGRKETTYGSYHCGLNLGHGTGLRIPDLKILLKGRAQDDIVWSWYSDCLLSDKVAEIFREEGFTGFSLRNLRAKKISPAAWRHVHLNGHYTFRDTRQPIDLDAIVAELDLG